MGASAADDSKEWEMEEELTALRSQLETTRKRAAEFEAELQSLRDMQEIPKMSMFGFQDTEKSPSSVPHSTPGPISKRPVAGLESSEQNTCTTARVLRREVIPEKYDGKKPWDNFILHFEACKDLNQWDNKEAASWLAASLTGDCVLALGPDWSQYTYAELKHRLERILGPCNSQENYIIEFRSRKRRSGESLPELGQAMRRLVMQAYPDMSIESQEQLVTEQFKDAVDDGDLRSAIFRAKAKTLDQAVAAAVETECFLKAEKVRRGRTGHVRMTEMAEVADPTNQRLEKVESQIQQLIQLMQDMKTADRGHQEPNQNSKDRASCYYCKERGHFKRECPKFLERNPEGYKQYLEKKGAGSKNGPRPNQGPEGRPTQ